MYGKQRMKGDSEEAGGDKNNGKVHLATADGGGRTGV